MKKHLLALFLTVFIGSRLSAQTTVPGGQVYGTWNLSGSPYNVMGSVMIPTDSTLSIDAGVVVNFQGAYKILVSGRLLAVGNLTDSIFFTSADTTIGWKGIDFNNTSTTNDTSRFSYCSVRYGKATGTSPDNYGGAFYINTFSKIVINNSRISECTANSYGGAIWMNACSGRVINNRIVNNTAHDASGICLFACSPVIAGNTISYNKASTSGDAGGIYISGSSSITTAPLVYGNTISHNSANGGGAMRITSGCTPIVSNNSISYNTTSGAGGAFYIDFNITSATVITGNTITNNTGTNMAGGIFCSNASPTISFNLISNNNVTSSPGAGGIYFSNSASKVFDNVISNNQGYAGGGIYHNNASSLSGTPVYTNNTIVNNFATTNGGGLYFINATSPTVRNCIIYGNTATASGNQVYLYDDNSDPNFYYCDVEGGTAAFDPNGGFFTGVYSNCLNTIPLFVVPSAGSGTTFNGVTANWALQNSSPCVDTGDPSYTPYPVNDIANNPRVTVCRIDMGAYEYQGAPPLLANPAHTDATCYNGCNGTAIVNPTGGSGPYTYFWTPGGDTTAAISNLCQGTYIVQVNESAGCSTIISVTITQPPSSSTNTVSICMVTVDSASANNIIYWDKSTAPLADTFFIYRDTANNNYALIGKVPHDSLSIFVDTVRSLYTANGDPNVSSWRYKVAVYDTCGNIGSKSPYHQTMFIQNSGGNFSWNHYQIQGQTPPVVPLSNYLFKRDDNSIGIWNTIQNVSASSTAYTDNNYSSYPNGSWRVETQWTITCSPTFKTAPASAMTTVSKSRSNIKNNIVANGLNIFGNSGVALYPNPAKDFVIIEFNFPLKNGIVEITGLTGRIIRSQQISNSDKRIQIDTKELSAGVYTLHITNESGKLIKKLVVEK